MTRCPKCKDLEYIPPKCKKCGFNEESDVFSASQEYAKDDGDDQRRAS